MTKYSGSDGAAPSTPTETRPKSFPDWTTARVRPVQQTSEFPAPRCGKQGGRPMKTESGVPRREIPWLNHRDGSTATTRSVGTDR
ncbi:hypothetical protein GCM10027200_65110 [Lentzea nigeriaca]